MLNTSEEIITGGYSNDNGTSETQRAWVASKLQELNTKSDASEWGIVVLCHYPADYGAARPLSNLFAAYVNGTIITLSGTAYNFSGKNAAKVIQNAMQKAMQKVNLKVMQHQSLLTKTDDGRTEDRIVYDPDHFFLARCGEVHVPYTDELDTLKTADDDFFTAKSIVKSYYLQVPVKGIEYATSSLGLVSGMAGSAWLGTATINDLDPVAVYLELRPGENKATGIVKTKDGQTEEPSEAVMYTTFNTFGKLPDSDSRLTITFDFITTHGGSHTQTIDITDEFNTSQAQNQQWILVDEVIELPKPTVNPNNSGGGFKPSVKDWEDVNAEIII